MAHAIESMLSVSHVPWHGLGRVVSSAPTPADAIQLAGLDWPVRLATIQTEGIPLDSCGKAVIRDKDGRKDVLGIVGPQYVPLQNRDAFRWFQPFIDAQSVQIETAGSLHNGRVVWVMGRVTQPGGSEEITDGDMVQSYVLLSNSHDGSQSIRVGFTPIRVVCANTLALAFRDEGSKLLRVRHTKGAIPTLREVRSIMQLSVSEFHATVEQYRQLAQRRINQADLRKYVTRVITSGEEPTARESTTIDECVARALTGIGNDEQPLTLWTAYNGVTEYLSYEAGRSQDTRLDSLWFGRNVERNRDALSIAYSLAL